MGTERQQMPQGGDVPRHVQLAETLRAEILEGRLSPGERLPAERELAERFDASRTTVRLALSALKSQGLIGSGHGKGTFVQKRRPIRVLASAMARRSEQHGARQARG